MRWFYNLKTIWKLLGGFAAVCCILAGVGWTGLVKLAAVNDMLNVLYDRELIGLSECKEANIKLIGIGREARALILETDPARSRKLEQSIRTSAADFRTRLDGVKKTIATAEGQALIEKIEEAFPEYMSQVNRSVALSMEGDNDEARRVMRSGQTNADELDARMSELAHLKESMAADAYEQSDVVYANSWAVMTTLVTGGVLLALGMGFFIARLVANPLVRAVRVLKDVAKGDFTARLDVDSKDEIGQLAEALNAAVVSIRHALQETRSVATSVAASAQELAAGSEEISSGAQEQASSLEETAASLEQITSTVQQNANNAQEASQLADNARNVAEKGGRIVSEAVDGMGKINESSKRIAEIITTMDEISFQTNLLALNAAVEAARAGEQGRGFAVVAGEVRKLARRSSGAAKEIKGLIQQSTKNVESGSSLVNQSGETLREIVTAVKRVTDIVAEIAAASHEQATGIEQVNSAVSQMDSVTQANASQTEELSSTAESLTGQAEQLQNMVLRFKLDRDNVDHYDPVAEPSARPMPSTATASRRSAGSVVESRGERSKVEQRLENELQTVASATSEAFGGFEEF